MKAKNNVDTQPWNESRKVKTDDGKTTLTITMTFFCSNHTMNTSMVKGGKT